MDFSNESTRFRNSRNNKILYVPQDIINNSLNITKSDNNLEIISMPLREAREIFKRQYLSKQINRFNINIF